MAQAPTIAMALATPTASLDIPNHRDASAGKAESSAHHEEAIALLTPPSSVSPELAAHGHHARGLTPPPMSIEQELELHEGEGHDSAHENHHQQVPVGTPLSKGALSGLDATAAITPSMLAKHHLPRIMLGNGPRPIRYVMGELTQSLPGFSRIPPAKARRLVVAALEGRHGGGPNGNITFCKTGWGRWDAHVKGSSRDSGIGSLNEGHMSPPRSERSGYAMSHGDSGVHMHGPRLPSRYRDQHSGGSWSSSIREEDELDMDMDMLQHEADKMSLDERLLDDDDFSFNDDTEEEEHPTYRSAPRKASLPAPGPRKNYNAISAAYARRLSQSKSWNRRPSAISDRPHFSCSLPSGRHLGPSNPFSATPEEQAAAAALISMGLM